MSVDCSKGTYIRTLCHDIGLKLQCGGCMKSLLRTKVGQFSLEDSLKLAEINEMVQQDSFRKVVIKADDMFPDYSKVVVAEEYCKYIYNGNNFQTRHLIEQSERSQEDVIFSPIVRVYDWQNTFVAIYQFEKEEEKFKPLKMFL
jgi:tRNA pseudouridine55 synthase